MICSYACATLGSILSADQWHGNTCKINDVANAAHCTTPMPLAAIGAGFKPHTPNLFFIKPPKLRHAHYASKVFELN
jgi:hypothetical protein